MLNLPISPPIVSTTSVTLEQWPTGRHFTGQSLTLTCWTYLNDSINTSIKVTHTWTGPSGTIRTDSRRRVTGVESAQGAYSSSLIFNSLHTSDSGGYSCQSTVHPVLFGNSASVVSSSDPKKASIVISAGILITLCSFLYSN